MSSRKLRVLFAASEVAGFAKTGGLADVAASLPRALAQLGIEAAIIMPFYRACRTAGMPLQPIATPLRVAMGNKLVEGRLWRSKLPGCDVPVYLIEQNSYFDRDDNALGCGLYQFARPDGQKIDYPDNSERFIFFSRAVLEALALLDFWPHILHINDWQTGLIPVYLKENYAKMSKPAHRARYEKIRSVFTIHNLAYQGVFWHHDWPLLGLPWRLFHFEHLEFYGRINFMKAAIVHADALTTVSPMYAREIQTIYYGCGLQGVLLNRSSKLTGIVNGIDDDVWNPATDPNLPKNYDVDTVAVGKAACKLALQKHHGLVEDPRIPLLGVVSRLASQKGLDLVLSLMPKLLAQKVQLIVLGTGDAVYQQAFRALAKANPKSIGVTLGYAEPLAHQIEAGADFFLMPSQYEPCGLNQLYSLRYGTVPIVRATGGLADTVTDANAANVAAGRATGFVFVPFTVDSLLEAVTRGLTLYRQKPDAFRELQAAGMRQDWSWKRSAAEYQRVYQGLLKDEE
ncbi:MAG: glycogen synthase GlgA [Planctomycetota bacterium]